MTAKDGRAIARANDVRVLRSLHRLGWARSRDLAALVWRYWAPTATDAPSFRSVTPTSSELRMAQRTLRRLRQKRWVLHATGPDGSVLYALAESGARVLRQAGIAAVTGKDLMRRFSVGHFHHRRMANEIAIRGVVDGFRVSTEREIAQGFWIGGQHGIAGKRPDVLLRSEQEVWWVEVERSRKNAKDYGRLLTWLNAIRKDFMRPSGPELLGGTLRWGKLVFVCTPGFQEKLCRDLAIKGWTTANISGCVSFSRLLYQVQDIIFI